MNSKHHTNSLSARSLSGLVELASNGSQSAENYLARFFLSNAMIATKGKLIGKLPHEDQEDIANSAVKSLCIGIRNGEIRYQGDEQLYSLLHKIIDGKIRKLWQYHLSKKRDIRRALPLENAHNPKVTDGELTPPESFHVTPEEQLAVDRVLKDLQAELRGLFMSLLSELDEHPRSLLLMLLERNATNIELSKALGRSVASIERYRQLIRSKLESLNTLD